jgi:hypothetical protein
MPTRPRRLRASSCSRRRRSATSTRALRARGHDAVVAVVRLPTTTFPRDWADVASPVPVTFGQMGKLEGKTQAHELLHLFGADDLYVLRDVDPEDDNDVMGGSCGRRASRVADQTAWAIGWLPTPPARVYATFDGDRDVGRPSRPTSPQARPGAERR